MRPIPPTEDIVMRLGHCALATLVAILLSGCTAPKPNADAPQAPAAPSVSAAPAAPMPTTPKPVEAPAAAPASRPPAIETLPGATAENPSRSCKTDSDCAVKNVGNCCGAYPMCVNKDARTDPAAVQAQCAKQGITSVCGFQEVSGCQCVKSQCQSLGTGPAVM
jgi:hypothetical protein